MNMSELEKQAIVSRFIKHGELKQMPTKLPKYKLVLEAISKNFEVGQLYSEKEVNTILIKIYTDYATIRRGLIDFKFMTRENGIYQRI